MRRFAAPLLLIAACASNTTTTTTTTMTTTAAPDRALFLGNEAVLLAHGGVKVLFDPFYYNKPEYTVLIPDPMRQSIFDQAPPFDGVEAVFVTHVHGDHYNGPDLLRYLAANTRARLYATGQALERLQREESARPELLARVVPVDAGTDPAWSAEHGSVKMEALRIAHIDIGRPNERMDHVVFRVTIGDGATVLHLGDADQNPERYAPHAAFWQARRTDLALAPFWFFEAKDGSAAVDVKSALNAKEVLGFHVWPNMIEAIRTDGRQGGYFMLPGESRELHK